MIKPVKPDIPEVSLYEFSKNFYKDNDRLPEEVIFELTYRCNLDCVHCYCNDASLKRKEEELEFKEICQIMDEIASEGCLWIAFTGGEPFVREDFFDLYLYAKKKGFIITILSNGTLIDEKVVSFLAEWPPRKVEVSLYGITKETHEKVTRIKGSFKKTMHAITLLKRHKINLEIKAMALNLNKHEIKKISDFSKGLGVSFRHDPLVHCKFNQDRSPHNFRLTPPECVDIDLQLKDMQEFWKKECIRYSGVEMDCEKLYTCGAGHNAFSINPYGKLQICGLPGRYVYDLKNGSFKEGWYDFVPSVINRKRLNMDFKCRDCETWALCSQCPPWAYLENGDEEKVIDYVCEIYKERMRRLGKGILKKEVKYAAKKV
jgi:radical SAM protein with 4Fe4S-binding SPASM domain